MADIDLRKRFTNSGHDLIVGAQHIADERKHAAVDPCHLLVCALEQNADVVAVFREVSIDTDKLLANANTLLDKVRKSTSGKSVLSNETIALIARLEKEHEAPAQIDVQDIIDALLVLKRGLAFEAFKATGISSGTVKKSDKPTHTTDLISAAKLGKFDPVVGRDKEVRRIFQILGRRTKNNPILIGDPGVGKTAIVNALATRIADGDAPELVKGLSMLELELSSVMSGGRGRGEVDERMKRVIGKLPPNTILVISGIECLFTGNGISGASDILKHVMSKGNVRLLATTTIDGSKKVADKDPALMNGFSQVLIDPPTPELAKEIIRSVSTRYAKHHAVAIGENAVASSVRLAKRYLQDKALPGSAIDLLDEAASRKRLEMELIPTHVDDAMRRLASLRLQRGALNGDSDPLSVKALKSIEIEIQKLEPEVEEMTKRLAGRAGAEVAVNTLRSEVAEVAASLAKAEIMKQSKEAERFGVELVDLKARLAEAERMLEKTVDTTVSNVVSEEQVASVLEDLRGIKASQMLESEMEKLSKMEERLTMRVMGQPEAVGLVSKAIRRARLGLRDPKKPIGSFLFLGSSGVGKTETAKALAEFLFDDESNMTRLDMSEFQEKHMVSRLLGSPVGYVGADEGGELTNAIKRKPYSVLLIDEVEKSHPDIGLLFLQILEDGRLSSSKGETVDFSNTVVIFTSNIGTKELLEAPPEKFGTPEGRAELALMVRAQLKNHMRPELINRLDNVVLFDPLAKSTLKGIIDIRLRELDRMLEPRQLKVKLTDAAKTQIVEEGYEPSFGARPIARAIVNRVQNPLSEELMKGGYQPGSVVAVDYVDGAFVFGKATS